MKLLRESRRVAETLAPSGINVGAMVVGPDAEQPGAIPHVVAKLLSAAQWWSPGKDGWHVHDETWNCTDAKDRFGRVTRTQGRVIWRSGEDGQPARRPSSHSLVPVNSE